MKIIINNTVVEKSVSGRANRYKDAETSGSFGIWTVAGHGTRSNDLCNTFKSVYGAEDGKEIVAKGYNCRRLSCPECFLGAASSKANKIALKILARAKHYHKNIYHWTFHFGEGSGTKWGKEYNLIDDKITIINTKYWGQIKNKKNIRTNYQYFSEMREKFANFLIVQGIEYAVLIFHPGHLQDDDKIHWWPHWHVVGIGKVLFKSNEFEKIYGFTYRNQGKRQFGFQVASTISYCLNHAGTVAEKQSYYWVSKKPAKDVMLKEAVPYQDEHGNYYKLHESSYELKGRRRKIDEVTSAFVMDEKFVIDVKNPLGWELEDKNWGGEGRIVLCHVRRKCSFGHFSLYSDLFDVPKKLILSYFDTMTWSSEKRKMVIVNWEKYREACANIRTFESQFIHYRGKLLPLLNKNSKEYRNISNYAERQIPFIVAEL